MGYQGMYGITPEQAGIDQSVLLGRLLGTILTEAQMFSPDREKGFTCGSLAE
ncbi:hypothetical protein ABZW11_20760 [Nonomuraea sp. NPDC004580]|uniref:hypothetical protein n=1 Tax=Nonomuraea sp. NPDC004580 TaxID=3154552 RepID=UPI0033BD2B93